MNDDFLVGGLEHFLCFHILGIIIPTDFHIFQRGWNHQPVLVLDLFTLLKQPWNKHETLGGYPWLGTLGPKKRTRTYTEHPQVNSMWASAGCISTAWRASESSTMEWTLVNHQWVEWWWRWWRMVKITFFWMVIPWFHRENWLKQLHHWFTFQSS